VKLSDYHYHLPAEQIAQTPAQPRDASRLLVLGRTVPRREDRQFRELAELLDPGDLLVANDTRVLPARLLGRKDSGGRAEVLLLHREGHNRWEALVRSAKPSRPATRIQVGEKLRVAVETVRGDGVYGVRLECEGDPVAAVEACGRMPLPPYIRRDAPEPRDREWYQTRFAAPDPPGSAAAPTAGLHFSDAVLAALDARGVERATVTLHVGLGTFLPVRAENLDQHRMHREWYQVTEATAAVVNRALDEGRRVVAVGTTTTRVLEHCGVGGRVTPGAGWTELFIRPGHPWRVVGGLVTNFHLPESTLLVLVAAFAGRDRVLAAYRHAVCGGYLFYSYGDAMVIL